MVKSKAMAGTRWPVENSLRLIILSVMLLIAPIRADPETRLLAFGCSNVANTNVTIFAKNLKAALAAVVENVVPSGFVTKNEAGASDLVDSVYALAQCRKDKSSTDCANCIKVARKKIGNCTKVTGGKASYDRCFLRYENYNFYNTSYTDPGNMEVCGTANASNSNSFSATAQSLINDLCTATPRTNGYFAAQTRQGPSNTTVYGLASCIRSLQRDSCEKCLAIAQDNINKCFSRSEGRAVDAGCYLRYDSKPFFPSNAIIDLADFLPRGKKASSTVWIIIGVVGGVFLVGLITCLLLFRKQIIKPKPERR
ncbi:cysteine-rich receptor-like protein kinase 2 [Cryptomeria japonica]|uniref:cysteine-rich receptor-like protein kinase 2 n=1 Tax=Cryptomeria japonica TaxID=3369 RepID=UPI0027DA2BE6|nr:cysteine-rich receptor-like protein kinase 2 [Cryptomeria japonica]